MFWTILITALITYFIYRFFLEPLYFSPLLKLPGPPMGKIPLLGNVPELMSAEFGVVETQWMRQYGSVHRHYYFLNQFRVAVHDPASIQHILSRGVYTYHKPHLAKATVRSLASDGLLNADGDDHKRQRKYMQSTFSYKYVREMAPALYEHTQELVSKWRKDITTNSDIIVDSDITNATLNMIGDVAFGCKFNAFQHGEVCEAYEIMFSRPFTLSSLLGLTLEWMQPFIPHFRMAVQAKKIVDGVVDNAIQEQKARIARGDLSGKDLLSVLLKEQQEEDGVHVSDEELRRQMNTMLLAGHETVASTLCWALHVLTNHPSVQDKLRKEIKEHFGDMKEAPTADQLHRLPYLDMVIKEVLRLYPVAVASFRQATQDDTLPTGDFLPKGTEVVIYMIILHRMEEYWGKDAAEFNPDRWYDIHPEQFPNFIHIYMPFLCGARTCIGQKLALLELKMVLVCLMQAFAFDPVPGHVVKSFISLTLRPSPHVKVHVKALGR